MCNFHSKGEQHRKHWDRVESRDEAIMIDKGLWNVGFCFAQEAKYGNIVKGKKINEFAGMWLK